MQHCKKNQPFLDNEWGQVRSRGQLILQALVPDAVIPLFLVMLHNKGNVLYPCLCPILISVWIFLNPF